MVLNMKINGKWQEEDSFEDENRLGKMSEKRKNMEDN
jgi:hypothetical protein